jgi:hypothetical protein
VINAYIAICKVQTRSLNQDPTATWHSTILTLCVGHIVNGSAWKEEYQQLRSDAGGKTGE